MQVTLLAIAFGGSAKTVPIPPARDPWSGWLRAVALGGAGRYAAAGACLDELDRRGTDEVLRSLVLSTRASHLRQAGRHDLAAVFDARALMLAESCRTPTGTAADAVRIAACCDALTGLAADDLGRGMFGAADRLLDRVQGALAARNTSSSVADDWIWAGRPELRLQWVRAELAMFTGDPALAIRHARTASEISQSSPSVRHRIKTDLIGAAAAATTGNVEAATVGALRVTDQAARFGQLPLQWAAAKLLDGIGAGGQWSGRAEGLRHELSRWGGGMR